MIISKKNIDDQYFQNYLKRILTSYLIWSILYLPYGIYYFNQLHLPVYCIPIVLVIALGYTGTCYHLWYIPALIIAILLVEYSIYYLDIYITTLLAFLLFLCGSIETYSSYLVGTLPFEFYQYYKKFFLLLETGCFLYLFLFV